MSTAEANSSHSDELPSVGDVVDDRYRIVAKIGVGGMGAVFAARDRDEDRDVALKVMLRGDGERPDWAARFLREARAARAIDSPHVVSVTRVGKLPAGTPYMVMELLAGTGLDQVIRERAPLPTETAVDYMLQACEGVAEAHAIGLIHRDLKPSNLFVAVDDEGAETIKVLDFGIAKATVALDPNTDGISLTESSSTLGSPQYMSPEQLRSAKAVDVRTDIWALGLILYKTLTGRAAFEADSVGEQFAVILSEPPTPLRHHLPGASERLEKVILCCLQKDVRRRYQDVGQLAAALAEFGSSAAGARVETIRGVLAEAGAAAEALPSEPTAATLADRTAVTARSWDASAETAPARSGRWGVAAVAAVLALAALGWWSIQRGSPAPEMATSARPVDSAPTSSSPPEPVAATSSGTAATVVIALEVSPPDARVELDGRVQQASRFELARSDEVHEVVVSAPGYEPARREVVARVDATLTIELSRRSSATLRRPSGGGPRPHGASTATPSVAAQPAPTGAPSAAKPQPSATKAKVQPLGPMEQTL